MHTFSLSPAALAGMSWWFWLLITALTVVGGGLYAFLRDDPDDSGDDFEVRED